MERDRRADAHRRGARYRGVRLTPGPNGPEVRDDNAVVQPEVFSSAVGTWATLPAGTVARNYHAVAVLLPDGRVFTGGSNANAYLGEAFVEKRIEIFTPWYCQPDVVRPVITDASDILPPGQTATVRTAPSRIAEVLLIRTGSVTHCYSSDQRLVELPFTATAAGELIASVPPDPNIVVPGVYLLFVLDADGVPSEGHFVRVPSLPHWSRWRG